MIQNPMVLNLRLMSISLIEPRLPTEPRRYRVVIFVTDTGQDFQAVVGVCEGGTGVDNLDLGLHLRSGTLVDFQRIVRAIIAFDQAQPREAESDSV
jgi:hypothetical protein